MAFTDFFCNAATGSNMNGGSSAGAATVTYTNSAWSTATNTFTPSSGNPQTDGVAVGDFVSIYTDGATAPVFIARVTSVTSTTFVVSATARGGTPPTTAASGISATVGGPWKGPNGTAAFPIGFNFSACVNGSGDPPRANLKNNAQYDITAAMTANVNGVTFQGYSATVGDGGLAIIDGGTSGASYTLLTTTTQPAVFIDLQFSNNGATGSSDGVSCSVSGTFIRCVFTAMRGSGLNIPNVVTVIECEAYGNNLSNTANKGGFAMTSTSNPVLIRCISHNNTGSNNNGFVLQGNNALAPMCVGCVADSNGLHGFFANNAAQGNYRFMYCTAYNNGGDGFRFAHAGHYYFLDTCLAVANAGTAGVNQTATSMSFPQLLLSCGFQGNSAETNNINSAWVSGKVSFGSQPMVDPGNGNFGMASAQGLGAGRGTFRQSSGYTATSTSYPDIGAVQTPGGQASAVFASPFGLGRRDYRRPVTRKLYSALPGSNITSNVYVPIRVDNPRARGRGPTVYRRVAPTLVTLPAVITTLHVPVPIQQRTRVVTVPSRPPTLRAFPVTVVQATAVPIPAKQRQVTKVVTVIRREPTVIITPPPQTVIVTSPRVVR